MLKNYTFKFVAVFLLGFLWAVSLRFMLVGPNVTHYHADFALYIDGERDQLESFVFYEEIAACSDAYSNNPASRVHLHDNISTLVHVHDEAATWSHLFSNLGYGLTENTVETEAGVHSDNDAKQLRFVLNGKIVRGVANSTIGDLDQLVVDYSNDSEEVLLSRYTELQGLAQAAEANTKSDPSTCSGQTADEGFFDRLKRTIGVN
ncbi:MAG: hypothetical protein AAF413_00425 [Patescibacteria group bacterium]